MKLNKAVVFSANLSNIRHQCTAQRHHNEDDTPFIYERIGTSVNHFLIDEFQDTSELQWHNMKPLLCNSLGSGYFNLIIGDEKQCKIGRASCRERV